jgi:hypothetical protein
MADEAEADIAAIFTRLRDEIRSRPAVAVGPRSETEEARAPLLPSRARADRAWAVTAERPFEQPATRRASLQRYLVAPIKRVLRKLMRWYVEPVAAQQRSFNLAVISLVDELAEQFDAEVRRLERRLDSLEAQLPAAQDDARG